MRVTRLGRTGAVAAPVFVVLVMLVIVAGVAVLLWLLLPSQAAGTYTTVVNETDVVVRLVPMDTVDDTVYGDFRNATGLFSGPRSPNAINRSYTIYVATERPRHRILQTYSHELEHFYLRNRVDDTEEQHAIITKKYDGSVFGYNVTGKFWNWRPEVLQLVDDI